MDAGKEFRENLGKVFAESNIRSLMNIISKYREESQSVEYFEQIINSRINRVTKIAPNKVTKKGLSYLLSITTIVPEKLISRPKFLKLVILLEYQKLIYTSEKVINRHLSTNCLRYSSDKHSNVQPY